MTSFKRPLFWLGLLLGGAAAFGARHGWCRPPALPDPLLNFFVDMTGDALVACDALGNPTYLNPAAQALFGPHGEELTRLCYPSGQPVPPGQRPPAAARGGQYRFASRVLEVLARQAPNGSALAVFRDATASEDSRADLTRALSRQKALSDLCRRLSAAADADALARAVVESAKQLLGDLPDVQVRLYSYDAATQMLTRLASDPEDHPKRPRSLAQSQKAAFRFDAEMPTLWQLYVARQPCLNPLPALGEAASASGCAFPLLTDNLARGHVSFASSALNAFDDPTLLEAAAVLSAAAAFALTVPQAAAQAALAGSHLAALTEFARAVAVLDSDALVAKTVREAERITGGACTVSVDPAEYGTAARKAARTQKTVRAAGVLAVPLAAGQGVLAVQEAAGAPLTATQARFAEALAALLSASMTPPRASPSAGRTDG